MMPIMINQKKVRQYKASDLAMIVSKNIRLLCPKKDSPKSNIASLCGVFPSQVTKWTSTDDKTVVLPPVNALITIADYFDVDLMWLLQDHDNISTYDYTQTYSGAFKALIALYDKGIIETTECVTDPILHYLFSRYISLRESALPFSEFNAWIDKILMEFDIPIMVEYNLDIDLHNIIIRKEPGVAAIDEDMQQRNLAKALVNPDIIERAIQRMADAANSNQNFNAQPKQKAGQHPLKQRALLYDSTCKE